MSDDFSQLNLHPQLVEAVTERGYTTPTPIQARVIPVMLAGKDVVGQAQTGTGKTAAFALPILHTITPHLGPVQALVLAPTRELAMQVSHMMYEYGRQRQIRVLTIYGGQPYQRQVRRLKKGVDVVVGTPGRLLDLIRQEALDLSQVNCVVLDEADEMLSMGFIEDIEAILDETPASRQTTLFSATLPPAIRKLQKKYTKTPEIITIKRPQLTVAAIEQRYYVVNEADKLAALARLFEVEPITTALIFARTRLGTGELANELTVRGYPAEALSGDLSQEAREQVMNRFRQKQIKVLVATDVAARGLDIDHISHVFNYDLPPDPEVYVHRIGRTGRAGKTGVAISLVVTGEQWRVRKIERYTRQTMSKAALPTVEEIQTHRETRLLAQMAVWLKRDRCRREREMVEQMLDEGHDLMAIAAAALKVARAEEKQRPIPPISEVRAAKQRNRKKKQPMRPSRNGRSSPRQRSHEKGMVRLMLNAGKTQGVRPNDVVGTIAYHANIPGATIGAIHIGQRHTLVDIPERFVTQVLDKSGLYQIRHQTITVERATNKEG